jgi:hypothetical protein
MRKLIMVLCTVSAAALPAAALLKSSQAQALPSAGMHNLTTALNQPDLRQEVRYVCRRGRGCYYVPRSARTFRSGGSYYAGGQPRPYSSDPTYPYNGPMWGAPWGNR